MNDNKDQYKEVSDFTFKVDQSLKRAQEIIKETEAPELPIRRSEEISDNIKIILQAGDRKWVDIDSFINEYKKKYEKASGESKTALCNTVLALGVIINSVLIVNVVYEQNNNVISSVGDVNKVKILFLLLCVEDVRGDIRKQWEQCLTDKLEVVLSHQFLKDVMNVVTPDEQVEKVIVSFLTDIQKFHIDVGNQQKKIGQKSSFRKAKIELSPLRYNIFSLYKPSLTTLLNFQNQFFSQLQDEKKFYKLTSLYSNIKFDGYVRCLIDNNDSEKLTEVLKFIFLGRTVGRKQDLEMKYKNLSDSILMMLIKDRPNILGECIKNAQYEVILYYLINDEGHWKRDVITCFLPILIDSKKIVALLNGYSIEEGLSIEVISYLSFDRLEAFLSLKSKIVQDKHKVLKSMIFTACAQKIESCVDGISPFLLTKTLKWLKKQQEMKAQYSTTYFKGLGILRGGCQGKEIDCEKLLKFYHESQVLFPVRYTDVMCQINELPDKIAYESKSTDRISFLLKAYLPQIMQKEDAFHFGIVYMIDRNILACEYCVQNDINLNKLKNVIAKGRSVNGDWYEQDGREDAYNKLKSWDDDLRSQKSYSSFLSSDLGSISSSTSRQSSRQSSSIESARSEHHQVNGVTGQCFVKGVVIGMMICSVSTAVLFQQQILQQLTIKGLMGYLLVCLGMMISCGAVGCYLDYKHVPTKMDSMCEESSYSRFSSL